MFAYFNLDLFLFPWAVFIEEILNKVLENKTLPGEPQMYCTAVFRGEMPLMASLCVEPSLALGFRLQESKLN